MLVAVTLVSCTEADCKKYDDDRLEGDFDAAKDACEMHTSGLRGARCHYCPIKIPSSSSRDEEDYHCINSSNTRKMKLCDVLEKLKDDPIKLAEAQDKLQEKGFEPMLRANNLNKIAEIIGDLLAR